MKKRLLIFLFIIMVLLPSALALVQVDGPTRNIYNIGDKFPLSGYVQEDSDVSGFLKMSVKCNAQEFPLQMVPVNLRSNAQKTFQELNVPQVTISALMDGQCYVEFSVVSLNKTFSSGVSRTFEVTKALEGNFLVEEPKVQIGDHVDISGTLLKADGSGVSGVAEIYFAIDGQTFLVDNIQFTDGIFNYTYVAKAIPSGAYSINIIARDVFGNVMTFNNAANFYLSNQLDVKVHADKAVVLPGENVEISGDVRTVLNKVPSGLSAEVSLNEVRMPLELKDGSFKMQFKVPENIKSGKHEINVHASDLSGNSGSFGVNIEVPAVATKLSIMADKQSYLPKDNLGITAYLYDQGSDLISTMVTFEILDPKGGKRASTTIQTNKLEQFRVPDFAMPGKWKLTASIKTLSTQSNFEILIVKQLDAVIDGEVIYLKNVGNVKHSGNVEILLKGKEEYQTLSRKSLLPNETVVIPLNKFAPNGDYVVTLQLPEDTSLAFDQSTEPLRVSIVSGRRVINLNIVFALLVGGLVFVLLYMALLKPAPLHKFERHSKYEPEFNMTKKSRKFYSSGSSGVSVKSSDSTAFDEVNDFKQRILRDIKQTEDKIARPGNKGRRGEVGGSGSAFSNMFR